MLKVMLVDDESIIRTGLKLGFDWQSNGCEIVAEAANGDEAFKMFDIFKPDIIVTDIRMQKCDGIEFMKKIKELPSPPEVIVLSGYDDFQYAKEALNAGAFSYLLKPVDFNALSQALEKIKIKIEKSKKAKCAESFYNAMQTETLIMSLITNPDESASIIDRNSLIVKKLTGNFFVAAISVNQLESSAQISLSAAMKFKECIEYAISTSENYIIKNTLSQTKYIFTVFLKNQSSYDNAIHIFENLLISFKSCSGYTASIGVSGIFRSLRLLSGAHRQAETALEHGIKKGGNNITDYIYINDKLNEICSMSDADIEKTAQNIKEENYDKAFEKLDKYFSEISKISGSQLNTVKDTTAKLAILVINLTTENTDIMKMIFGRTVIPVAEIAEFNSTDEIRGWIYNLINRLKNSTGIYGKDIKNKNVCRAVSYITAQYNSHLTVEWIAKQLYMSPRHLMRLFKQETGMTFNKYLTNYRMTKATQLFKSGEYKIYEVAQLVGYSDSKYFCKQFKKVTGKNPSDL